MTLALDYLLAFLVRAVTGIPLRDPLPGHDPERPALFYANHGSHLDSIVIWASIPPRWRRRFCVVAAADYWRPGSFRYNFARLLFDLTPVERGPAVKPSRELLERLARPLEDGKSLLIFPEGTRSRDGAIREFRGGLHYLACRFPEVPLVPVRLDNLNRILPKGEALPVPLLGRLEFLPPLARVEGETKEDFLARARAAILARA